MLEAKRVSFVAGGRQIVRDVTLRVEGGDILALVGPNGAGKSTLVKLLSGMGATPESGEVLVEGRPMRDLDSREIARRRAVVSQEQTLQADFPAFDVVLMGRTPHVTTRETEHDFRIAADALHEVNATSLGDLPFTVLSGGEKQRIALARAGAQIWDGDYSRYLLLDEPTNNLDLEHQHVALKRARRWAREGVGVLVVLHDLNLAAQYADRIAVMDRGSCVASGTPREVLTPSLMRRVFRTEARVESHPTLDCPLVVTLCAVEEDTGGSGPACGATL